MPAALRLLPLLLVVACAPSLDQRLGQPGLEAAIKRHYAAHAWERNAACTLPRMQTITTVTKVGETESELVVDLRYHHRPGFGDSFDRSGDRTYCSGWATRRFTLGKRNGGLVVLAMSGEQRPAPR
jgi:hypothetical protein